MYANTIPIISDPTGSFDDYSAVNTTHESAEIKQGSPALMMHNLKALYTQRATP